MIASNGSIAHRVMMRYDTPFRLTGFRKPDMIRSSSANVL